MQNPFTDTNIGFHFIHRTLGSMACFGFGGFLSLILGL